MLAQFIYQLRQKNNLTQEFLASELGISRPTYVQIERGERDLTIRQAQKLAGIFNIPLDMFLRGQEGPRVVLNVEKAKKQISSPEPEIRISVPQEKIDKFHQVLLYIIKKVRGKSNAGKTVLYKLLYFIDLDYYEKYEDQLMGLAYIKNQYGPTPQLFDDFAKEMVRKNEIEIIKSKFYQHSQTKYLINPAIEPDLTVLNGREKEHIDWELQRLSDLNATQLTYLSHQDVPWISAEDGKLIDYESVFYRTPITSVRTYDDTDDN